MSAPTTLERLRRRVAHRLARWIRDSRTGLHLDAGGDPVLYQIIRSGEDERIRGIIDLLGILRDCFSGSGPLPPVLEDWSRITLPYAALSAARLAVHLARQLGATLEVEMDPRPATSEETARREQCVRLALSIRELLPEIATGISRGIRARRAELGLRRKAKRIHFVSVVGHPFAEWRDGTGALLRRESLEEWLSAVADGPLGRLAGETEVLGRAQASLATAGLEHLEEASEELHRVVMRALHGGPDGVRILRARHRGVPHDVWLVMRQHRIPSSGAGCALVMRRGHRSFVLQSIEGNHFFFPPSVLAAAVVFTVSDLRVIHPLVAQPRVGYHWMHPYTGQAGDRGLGALSVPEKDACPLLPDLSEEESALFGELRRTRGTPVATDICLSDQSEIIYRLAQRIRGELAEGSEPDVVGLLVGMLDLLRRGLTHGHQLNLLGPRAPLRARAMLSPVSGKSIPPELADRVFPFDPSRPDRPPGLPVPNENECLA